MIYKLTSINTVISKIVRDLGLGHNEVPWQDMIEWIAEGLEHIGAYYQFTEKEAMITITDHKGVLPCDFHKAIKFLQGCSMHGLTNTGPYWSAVSKEMDRCGYRNIKPDCKVNEKNCMQITDALTFQKLQLLQYKKIGSYQTLYNGLMHSQSLMAQGITYTPAGGTEYSVNHDTVTANFRYGFIALRYLAFPVDENGYPLVPDDVSFRDALMWKVAMQLSMRGYQFKNDELNSMETCRYYWNLYCVQARAGANMPDPDTMERLGRIFQTLAPDYHQYYTDFTALGKPNSPNLDSNW